MKMSSFAWLCLIATGLLVAALLATALPASAQTVASTIAVGAKPRYLAVNPTTNRIYVSNGGSNDVSVIDGARNAVVATVAVGTNPQGVAANPATNRVYVANLGSDDVTVIDGASNKVAATIKVGKRPLGIAVNSVTNKVYVGDADGNDISVVDGASNAVVATIPFASGPNGLAVNPAANRLYVVTTGSEGVLSVIDTTGNTVVATLPSGSNSAEVAVNPATNRFYVTNTMIGNVSVFDGANNTLITTVNLGERPTGSFGVAANPTTNHIWLTTFSRGTNSLVLFDGASNTVTATLANVGSGAEVAVNPATNLIYVVDTDKNAMAVLRDSPQAGASQPTKLPNTGEPALPTWAALVAGLALLGLGLQIKGRVGEGRGSV
ncbi:MAG: YncE family protein [Chloroflexi bacterium]|nr:YncE family protein [Chloroflexota bacterium]